MRNAPAVLHCRRSIPETRCIVAQQQLESLVAEIARAAAVLFHEGRMPISVSVWYSDGTAWQPGLGCESLRQAEWEPVLAQTLRTGLTRTRRNHRRPVCVTIWFSDHNCVQFSLFAGERSEVEGADDMPQCKQDITTVLDEKRRRLTTSKILKELRVRELIWGESTIKRALAEMVRDHELNNRRDLRPRGYGLPTWH
jgi:hypothetical protein